MGLGETTHIIFPLDKNLVTLHYLPEFIGNLRNCTVSTFTNLPFLALHIGVGRMRLKLKVGHVTLGNYPGDWQKFALLEPATAEAKKRSVIDRYFLW